jgi:hypothetical protein
MKRRRGWLLDYIPDDKASWQAFSAMATPEQAESVVVEDAIRALLTGDVDSAREHLEALMEVRRRRGVWVPRDMRQNRPFRGRLKSEEVRQ